jgi:hypothetical protein
MWMHGAIRRMEKREMPALRAPRDLPEIESLRMAAMAAAAAAQQAADAARQVAAAAAKAGATDRQGAALAGP